MSSSYLPKIVTEIPGPRSRELTDLLADHECPAVSARREARIHGGDSAPIVWHATEGLVVEDADGNRFLDFTAGFGVATVGHGHPEVIAAAHAQLDRMTHAMGDAFPSDRKAELAHRLADLAPGSLTRCFFGSAGFEAVEAALKTAVITTRRPRILAYDGAYHGLGYGALAVTGYRREFREPFLAQLNPHVIRALYPYCYRCPFGQSYPSCELFCAQQLERQLDHPANGAEGIGAVIIEPIQGRGGVVEAPLPYLQRLRTLTRERGILLIVDEIFTGFGRTGERFAIEAAGVEPDLLVVGKGMTGGFPISAAIGSDHAMSGWADSAGEAIHTSTFMGNPLGCAMALATIDVLENGVRDLVRPRGEQLRAALEQLRARHPQIGDIRGRGLMIGVELVSDPITREPAPQLARQICSSLLQRGIILLPSGVYGNVLSITPPFVVRPEQLDFFIDQLSEVISETHGTN